MQAKTLRRADAKIAKLVPALLLAVAAFVLPRAAQAADTLDIVLDQATIMKLPDKVSTIVVGNPLIADATVQPGGVVVITAKSYGTTNLIALDRAGVTLSEVPIQVIGPGDAVVVVYRGVERESYSCAPICERRITLGDSATFFAANLSSLSSFNALVSSDQKK